jgi:16S rRNA pseudouridine516 synthase
MSASASTMRLTKFIAKTGLCSHHTAKRLVSHGMVTVDGRPANPFDMVSVVEAVEGEGGGVRSGESIFVFDNQALKDATGQILGYEKIGKDGAPAGGGTVLGCAEVKEYWMFHKPVGVDCRILPDRSDSIVHHLPATPRLFPVGRLDKDSRGQLLLTNDGDLSERIMQPAFQKRKTYRVKVHREFDERFLEDMAQGVTYGRYVDVTTSPCEMSRISPDSFEIVLTQGLNRQIRKMAAALGYTVVDLLRVQMQSLELGALPEGEMRRLTSDELGILRRTLELDAAVTGMGTMASDTGASWT